MREFAESAGLTSVGAVASRAGSAIRSVVAPGDGPRVNLPMSAGAADAVEPVDHRPPPVRDALVVAENIKRLKDATGGTVNDVVMAICAGALRAYLAEHDALPDRPLRAMVPVSIRTGDEEDTWTNRVSGLVVDLPTNLADPLERVARATRRCSRPSSSSSWCRRSR